MSLISIFFIAFILSALGSMPTGMITLTIMQRSIMWGKKAGIIASLGATIPEFAYTYIALKSLPLFQQNELVNQHIQTFAGWVFLGLAIYYLAKKPQEPKLGELSRKDNVFSFLQGLITASLNVLIIPFWIFLASWLESFGYTFGQMNVQLIFSLGSAFGALLIFLAYTELGHLIFHRLSKVVKYTNKLLGGIFLVLALYQLIVIAF